MSKGDDLRLHARAVRPSRAVPPLQGGGTGPYGDRAAWEQEHERRIQHWAERVEREQQDLAVRQRRAGVRVPNRRPGVRWSRGEIALLRRLAEEHGPLCGQELALLAAPLLGRSASSIKWAIARHGVPVSRPGG